MAVHLSAFGPEMGGFRASSMSRSSVMMILLLLLVGPTFSFTMNEIEAKKQLEVRDPRFQNPVVGFPHQTVCRLTPMILSVLTVPEARVL
jgi:hypothetical protein